MRHLTAMDDYYQNGPLPTWLGWYVQQLPHWFHAATALMTLVAELGFVWMLFLPRRFRIICFLIVTPFQIGIILTANYTFLNYLVLVLGFLLLDDGFIRSVLPQRWKDWGKQDSKDSSQGSPSHSAALLRPLARHCSYLSWLGLLRNDGLLFAMISFAPPFPLAPARALDPFRIANQYGLFANMTHERYELISRVRSDGQNWTTYSFATSRRISTERPASMRLTSLALNGTLVCLAGQLAQLSLGGATAARLLQNEPDVLALFGAIHSAARRRRKCGP